MPRIKMYWKQKQGIFFQNLPALSFIEYPSQNYHNVFMANGKHDPVRCILGQIKDGGPRILWKAAPLDPLTSLSPFILPWPCCCNCCKTTEVLHFLIGGHAFWFTHHEMRLPFHKNICSRHSKIGMLASASASLKFLGPKMHLSMYVNTYRAESMAEYRVWHNA